MKHRNKVKRLQERIHDFERLTDTRGKRKPGSIKKTR